MQSARSMGIFILVCASICLAIAVEKYYSAVRTAQLFAEALPEIEFESAQIPVVSMVCGAVGVALFVAGAICVINSFRANVVQ